MGPARFPGAEQGLHQVSEALLPLVAVVAGVISFSSPCCLPLVPGYLSYVSALPVAELGERDARRVPLRAALLFVRSEERRVGQEWVSTCSSLWVPYT